jgi:hypothetical protein
VDFRTVGWKRASVIFLKGSIPLSTYIFKLLTLGIVVFATGVLKIPSTFLTLGTLYSTELLHFFSEFRFNINQALHQVSLSVQDGLP